MTTAIIMDKSAIGIWVVDDDPFILTLHARALASLGFGAVTTCEGAVRALEVLTRLHLKRFRISIDDFGTGHSSLAQLRDIPFDELKIDRGFVHRAWADETVRAIFDTSVLLAKQLGMQIVAEGVGDRADWDFVRRSGCGIAQGNFIARPMPAEEIPDWIEDWDDRVQAVL